MVSGRARWSATRDTRASSSSVAVNPIEVIVSDMAATRRQATKGCAGQRRKV